MTCSRSDQEKSSKHLFHLIVGWKRAFNVGFPCKCVIETLLPLEMSQACLGMCPQWRLHTSFLTGHHSHFYPVILYPGIPCRHILTASQLKCHLTFIPAFAVETTVKQSSAFAFVCTLCAPTSNRDPSLCQSFPGFEAQTDLRMIPQVFTKSLCESMTQEYA